MRTEFEHKQSGDDVTSVHTSYCSSGYAADLAMIGGLPTLLRLLGSPRPGLRARAAEVLATCAQANPPVQARPCSACTVR